MKNSKIRFIQLTLAIFLFAVLANCTGERILKKYYVFNELTDSTYVLRKPLPYSVMIEPFWANPAYKTKQIALRTKDHEIQYYYYHQWSEAPDIALRFLVWRKLKSLNLFQNCELAIGQVFPKYGIGGTLDWLEIRQRDKNHKYPLARIKARLELFDFKTRQTVIVHSFARSAELPKKYSMNQFVSVVNQMVNQELDRFIQKILETLQ